jgi:predicted nuclease with TOPRIM domain
MAPRIPNPLGGKAELVSALRYLPRIAENTASMAKDTRALADLRTNIARVAERTEGIKTMDARMANIESTMPVLVDVQKDLAAVPEMIAKLDDRIEKLSVLLEELAKSVEGLQRSITPLGRIAGRLPGGSKPAKHERESELDSRGGV